MSELNQEPPRRVWKLDYAPRQEQAKRTPFIWISAGLVLVPSSVLLCMLAYSVAFSTTPVDSDIALVLAAPTLLVVLAESLSLARRSPPATFVVVIAMFIVLVVDMGNFCKGTIAYPDWLVELVVFVGASTALVGHIAWFMRIAARESP